MTGTVTYRPGYGPPSGAPSTETDEARLERLSRALLYNEGKRTRANGVEATRLRREIRRLERKGEAGR